MAKKAGLIFAGLGEGSDLVVFEGLVGLSGASATALEAAAVGLAGGCTWGVASAAGAFWELDFGAGLLVVLAEFFTVLVGAAFLAALEADEEGAIFTAAGDFDDLATGLFRELEFFLLDGIEVKKI